MIHYLSEKKGRSALSVGRRNQHSLNMRKHVTWCE